MNPSGTALRYFYDTGNRRVAARTVGVSAPGGAQWDLFSYDG